MDYTALPGFPNVAVEQMMSDESENPYSGRAVTPALRRAFAEAADSRTAEDLLYLERWEVSPLPGPAAALRVSQIRRANPELASAIRREAGAKRV